MEYMEITRPTVMEVDLRAFEHNVNQIRKFVGNNITIMPVLKANAYGTYINLINDELNKFDIVAVAIVDEAVELRKQGYEKEIFVLNPPDVREIEKIFKYKITVGICTEMFCNELSKYYLENTNEKANIHIEIDTGMGRTGVQPNNLIEFIKKIKKYENINIEGIYTHFSSADIDFEYTKKQINIFEKCVCEAKKLVNFKYIHSSASNGILNFSESNCNLIRPGIILYGYEAGENTYEKLDLKPVCKLKSKITFLKEVEKDVSIGYSRSYITNEKKIIATVPIGYADGLPRMLSNKGYVVINENKSKIVGSVCMDSIMIDVSNIDNVSIGDDVYIWDNNLIKLEDIANLTDTINYEIISTITRKGTKNFFERIKYV